MKRIFIFSSAELTFSGWSRKNGCYAPLDSYNSSISPENTSAKFFDWSTGKSLAVEGTKRNITMARNSAWLDPDIRAQVNPGIIETQAYAAANGYSYDRPFMSPVGKAADSNDPPKADGGYGN